MMYLLKKKKKPNVFNSLNTLWLSILVFGCFYFLHKLQRFTWKCSHVFILTLHLLQVTFSLGVHSVWICLKYLFTRYDVWQLCVWQGQGHFVIQYFCCCFFFLYPLRAILFLFFILECNNQSTSDKPTKPCWASYTHTHFRPPHPGS